MHKVPFRKLLTSWWGILDWASLVMIAPGVPKRPLYIKTIEALEIVFVSIS